jgi:cytochrome c oxidase assembly protein subunit 15
LWGVFLRASFSGDGCGQHWLTCKGEVIPSAPELKTVIEFTHRLTSGLALITVFALWIWSRKDESLAPNVRSAAKISFVFVVIEALIGGGLVLTGNTAGAVTASRPFWMAGHLVNTFCLLAALALTARFASGANSFALPKERRERLLLLAAFLGIILVGVTGTFAALAGMIFPSPSIAEGFARDFAQDSHLWVRLRVLHPFAAIALGFYLITLGGWFARRAEGNETVKRWSGILTKLVVVQLAWGALTVFTHAPIAMQLVHLLLADLLLISFTVLTATFLSQRKINSTEEILN